MRLVNISVPSFTKGSCALPIALKINFIIICKSKFAATNYANQPDNKKSVLIRAICGKIN